MPATCAGGDAPLGGLVPAMTVDERTELRQWAAERRFGSGIREGSGGRGKSGSEEGVALSEMAASPSELRTFFGP